MRAWTLLPFAALLVLAPSSPAAARTWEASGATVTFALDDEHLKNVGLQVVDTRAGKSAGAILQEVGGTTYAFDAATVDDLRFESTNGSFTGFTDGRAVLPIRGGLALQTQHPRSGKRLSPLFLYDFVVEIDPSRGRDPIVVRSASDGVERVQVRNAGFFLDQHTGVLSYRMGDLQVSKAWAQELGQPEIADQWIGGFDVRIRSTPNATLEEHVVPDGDTRGTSPGTSIDVTLGELYGLTSQGHIGTYPNGTAGLSAATTSCNTGTMNVPWNGPMAETHPWIGLALFREQNGVLEMIGKNWMKHGFFALSNDQCDLGCSSSNGSYLGIGCSDTYSAGNNGSRFYLGPRHEVNPYTGTWEACGSYFDEPGAPDADCSRDYNGSEPNSVLHRLEVQDADLDLPGATYYYEGEYIVTGDTKPGNSIGWRTCTMSWTGSNWSFNTTGGGLTPTYGPLVETWGDLSKSNKVASDDGEVILSVQTTDLGGGQWHYEYALYNWTSDREVQSFSIPVGSANITNVGFHDPDTDAGNDWTAQIAGGAITWSTDDWATNQDANSLEFQSMFNFRFDADAPPVLSEASGTPYKPGTGSLFTITTNTPSAAATDVAISGALEEGIQLSANEPNPFARGTQVSFTLPTPQSARMSVHDVTGRTIQVLFDDRAPAGTSRLNWNGRDANGSNVASGVYFFRLSTANGTKSVKATLRR
ncbi:MAG: hypothetical protein DHS20C21_18910 [Gemmatimonadota bacterium]|nr:MAG: hypothetical protein DHS20C21_18910 [Gemmatimonadota bacterium]